MWLCIPTTDMIAQIFSGGAKGTYCEWTSSRQTGVNPDAIQKLGVCGWLQPLDLVLGSHHFPGLGQINDV